LLLDIFEAHNGSVTIKKSSLRLPAALRAFRLSAGMQQQVLAEKVEMGQAALCALEKGRRPVPDAARITAIGAALSLSPSDLLALQRWAKHDRLVAHLAKEDLEEAIPLMSLALQCSMHLNARQRTAVCAELARHVDAVTHAAALDGASQQHEEAAM
jgi:transcriptional regulator with XRE-family HTH domain